MTEIRVVHTTAYKYHRPVRFTRHRLMMRPRDSHDLRLVEATLGVTPTPGATRWAHDVFGNSICYLDMGDAPADQLRIVSTLDLEHFPAALDLPVDPLAETYPLSYDAEEFPDLARLIERQYPDPEGRLERWARKFTNRNGPTRTMEMLTAMTQAVKADFTYQARDAEGTNPPLETLATGAGACRDFALLMMESVRALGLAARFISGYLYDEHQVEEGQGMVGGGATHAWCGVYVPGAGWVEFDPTNGLTAGRNLIRVSVARTPGQAVPVSGGYIGGPDDLAGMTVNVEISGGHGD